MGTVGPTKKAGPAVGDTPPRCQESRWRDVRSPNPAYCGVDNPRPLDRSGFLFLDSSLGTGNSLAAKHATPLVLSPDGHRAGIESAEGVGMH